MNQRKEAVTMGGNPLTLLGPELETGVPAPDFEVLNTRLEPVTLAASKGKVRVFSVVPSLDTPVCDTQTRRFDEYADELGDEVAVYTVSADLPFAAARWCTANGVEHLQCLSDHRGMSFGNAYGTHVEELRLDARAVFVVDRNDRIVHVQYVKELTEEPDYEAVVEAARIAAGS
ncbi:MAG: thiol peroxidase [Deltaproteobacteria bacterium]|nr:MAG: thiol peroxidase [Deltaproteobacteria bacterium]